MLALTYSLFTSSFKPHHRVGIRAYDSPPCLRSHPRVLMFPEPAHPRAHHPKTRCPPSFKNHDHCALPTPLFTSTVENPNAPIVVPILHHLFLLTFVLRGSCSCTVASLSSHASSPCMPNPCPRRCKPRVFGPQYIPSNPCDPVNFRGEERKFARAHR
ncbi:hypothetical protein BJV77DRAFT_412268 [Russula vinacea]|nr:hypothetical protein BJV77DRAFT_412268 [Russula vinacea]